LSQWPREETVAGYCRGEAGLAVLQCCGSTQGMKPSGKVKQPFLVLNRRFGYAKTLYRDLGENQAHPFALLARGNRITMRKKSMA